MFCEELESFLQLHPAFALIVHQPDLFRAKHCYQKETDAILTHHKTSLRAIFDVYSELGTGGVDVEGALDLMSAAEWMALMRDIGLVKECGVRNLYLIFAHSRMACVDESSKKSVQLMRLPFEGFLEAIVRLSFLKALPSDKEMKRKDFQFPGEYIGSLLDQGRPVYDAWVLFTKRAQGAGRGDPVFRRVDMLVLLIISVIHYGVELQPDGPSLLLRGSPDEKVTLREVKMYIKKPTRFVFEELPADDQNKKRASQGTEKPQESGKRAMGLAVATHAVAITNL